jgi:hypothetical protein
MSVTFDTSRDPMHLQVLVGRSSYDEVNAHFDALEAYVRAKLAADPEWHPSVFADARRARGFGARERRRLRECFGRLGPLLADRMVAHAIVVGHRVGSGVLNAVFWLQEPPWPIRVFVSPDEAYTWIIRRHYRARLPLPSLPPRWWEVPPLAP